MIDMHCHLLPGIDDGALDVPEAMAMAQIAVEEGVHTLVVTPHFYPGLATPSPEEIRMATKYLQLKLQQKGINVRLVIGQEIFFALEIPEMIRQRQLLTIGGLGKHVLIELPMLELPDAAEEIFFRLLTAGVTPVVAHPERNEVILRDPNLLYDWINKGILVQMNTGSITGVYGSAVAECAALILKHNLVHFLGTDAHSSKGRSPRMAEAIAVIVNLGGKDLVQELLLTNPSYVIEGKKLDIRPPSKIEAPDNWLQKIRKKVERWGT